MSSDAVVADLKPPTGGLNYQEPAISLSPLNALVLDNILPKGSSVELRAGYKVHCKNLPGSVVSIASYVGLTREQSRTFAFLDNGKVYDVTYSSSTAKEVLSTDQFDGIWESVSISGIQENFLAIVSTNGGYWTYSDREGFVERKITGLGQDLTFASIFHWKDRLWLIEAESNCCFYLAVGAIQGDASEYDFSAVLNHGGYLAYGCNWTFNAGFDIDDYLVLVTTQGEVVVYKGTDPDSLEKFALEGVWYVGKIPAGRRSFTSFGGELLITSALGIVPLSKLVNGKVANEYQTASTLIQPVFSNQFNVEADKSGWELEMIYNQQFLLVKTPIDNFGEHHYYVMNTNSGAWATISNMPMLCTTQVNDSIYFGTSDGLVCQAFVGDTDGESIDGESGRPIVGKYLSGFNDFGAPSNLKTFQLVRPIFVSTDPPGVGVKVFTDFTEVFPLTESRYMRPRGGIWDKDKWDKTIFAGGRSTFANWIGLTGMGHYGALAIVMTGTAGTQYVASTMTMKKGGVM